jgi:hypothetical protein
MFRFFLIALSFGMATMCLAAESAVVGKTPPAPAERSYKKFAADEPMQDWRRANDTVREVGGWRAYAKEAARANRATPAAEAKSPAPVAAPKERK